MTVGELRTLIRAKKSRFNAFGKYSYRSAEDICEAVKPILAEQGIKLQLRDEVVEVGGRLFIHTLAVLTTADGETVSGDGWAQLDEAKKGMDGAQLTGAALSYSRKYALGGLLLLDDSADSDSIAGAVEAPAAPTTTTTTTNQAPQEWGR